MAYHTIKKCANQTCEVNFICNSNKQTYCKPCATARRLDKRKDWNTTYRMKNGEQLNAESRAYNKSEKGRAAQQLRDAVRQGKIKRQPCEVCGEPDAQGHHTDYSKPLEVRWLCAKHHREEHLLKSWMNDLRRAGYEGGFELSELIEACGDKFRTLTWHKSSLDWTATGFPADKPTKTIMKSKKTPTEAIAKLWLALHPVNN